MTCCCSFHADGAAGGDVYVQMCSGSVGRGYPGGFSARFAQAKTKKNPFPEESFYGISRRKASLF
ncbi:MAG: hypothetical protein CSA22_08545 [Deltaproteobacteria bacterium]|nr:MAG: hypothetical protein CSA22_08545 [Deltaproteobacteria bacterium]